MTVSEAVMEDWAAQTTGKVVRVALGVGGMITSFLVLLMAGFVPEGTWLLILAGVALAATSVRAAWIPSVTRLATVAANLIAIPVIAQLF